MYFKKNLIYGMDEDYSKCNMNFILSGKLYFFYWRVPLHRTWSEITD